MMKAVRRYALLGGLSVFALMNAYWGAIWLFYAATDTQMVGEFKQTGTKDVYLIGFQADGSNYVEALVAEDIRTYPPYLDFRARSRFLAAVPGQRACVRVVGLRWGWMHWSRNILAVNKQEACGN